MPNMKNLIRLSILSFFYLQNIAAIFAQNTTVGIGSWREHPPFIKAVDVAEDNSGLIYCAGKFSLFSFSKSTGEINILSRLNVLSDREISTIRFDEQTGVLFIIYANSNIDLIFPDKKVYNLPDIYKKNIIGGKNIYSVLFVNGLAYLSCEFGIVLVDINRKEIKDTYYIGPNGINIKVNDLAYDGTTLMAVTDNGIYNAVFNDPNIFNYTAWSKDTTPSEPNASYTSATSFNGKFYVVKTNPADRLDTVLVKNNNSWTPFILDDAEGGYIDTHGGYLIYRNKFKIAALDETGTIVRPFEGSSYPYSTINRGFLSADGNFWVADMSNGLVKQTPNNYVEIIAPNGPRSDAVWSIDSKNGRTWVTSGAIFLDTYVAEGKNGLYLFSDNEWKTYDSRNDTVYSYIANNGSPAVNCCAIDPSDADHAFIGSWGNGLLEYRKEGGVKRYNKYNSTLHPLNADQSKINVGGVIYDDDGNLWVVNCGTTKPISALKKDGSWQDFYIGETVLTEYSLYNLVVDDYGQKWFCARQSSEGKGLCVFKEAALDNPNNGSYKRLTTQEGNGALPDIFVKSIAKDKDGSIWLGTSSGVAVIYNPGNVFSGGSFDAQKIIIQQDGYNQYLLETEVVSAIAIDGANRKWFGTYNGGVFFMSADGTKQLANFNKDNSPLPSNSILDIAIDDVNGEVFFATDKGIISYRGDATEGGEECKDYYVFPNPIRHDYQGPIAIRGLVANADVKITDVAGNIVYHTKANGGEAIWYGKNMKGERAQTGVYTVFVTNEDGSQTCVTKMVFAN
jgi:hypothetical protein